MAIRLSLYEFYKTDFADLTTSEFYASLLMGFRVDMITIFTFSSVFVLLLLFVTSPRTRGFLGVFWALILTTIFILCFSDVLYYDYIHRHMSNELFNLGNDEDIIIGAVFGSMLSYSIGALILSVIFLYTSYKIFSHRPNHFISGKKLFFTAFLVILALFLGIRNNFSGKGFGTSDAYAVDKISSGNLALNGFFTVYRTVKSPAKHNLMSLDKAVEITRTELASPNTPFIDDTYPLLPLLHNSSHVLILIKYLINYNSQHDLLHYSHLHD